MIELEISGLLRGEIEKSLNTLLGVKKRWECL